VEVRQLNNVGLLKVASLLCGVNEFYSHTHRTFTTRAQLHKGQRRERGKMCQEGSRWSKQIARASPCIASSKPWP